MPLERLAASGPHPLPRVPADWLRSRCIAQLRLHADQRWLDLRRLETVETLRAALAPFLQQLALPDLDVSVLRGPSRPLTRAVARWAYDAGYQGIAYRSRFDDAFDCWAVFEGADDDRVGNIAPITADDPDLRAAAKLFGLAI